MAPQAYPSRCTHCFRKSEANTPPSMAVFTCYRAMPAATTEVFTQVRAQGGSKTTCAPSVNNIGLATLTQHLDVT